MSRTILILVTGLALTPLGACGSSSSSGGQGTPVSLVAKNTTFDKTTISAQPGTTITVTVQNMDTVTHSFTTTSGPTADMDIAGGASNSVTFTPPQSGTVSFHCKYHASMTGTITLG
jgi:plastocyanin